MFFSLLLAQLLLDEIASLVDKDSIIDVADLLLQGIWLTVDDILINYPGWYGSNMALMNLGQIKLQVPIVIINKKLLLSACASGYPAEIFGL